MAGRHVLAIRNTTKITFETAEAPRLLRAGLAGTATIEIPARLPDRAKRTATVEMRFGR